MITRFGFIIGLTLLAGAPFGAWPLLAPSATEMPTTHRATAISSISYYGSFTTTEAVRVWRGVTANLLVQGPSVASARTVEVRMQSGALAQGVAVQIASRVAPSRLTISLTTNPSVVILGTYRVRILYGSGDIPPEEFLVHVYDRGTISTITMDAASDMVVGARYAFTAVGTNLLNAQISKNLLGTSISDARVDSRTSTKVKFSLVAATSGARVDVNAAHFFDKNMVTTSVRTDTRASTSSDLDPWLYGGAGTIRINTVVKPIQLEKVSLNASSAIEGQQVTGTVTTNVAPPQGSTVIVTLSSSSPFVSVPAQVVVSSGNSAPFVATVLTGAAAKQATITATAGGGSFTATLTVAPIVAVLTGMTFEVAGQAAATTATVNSGETASMRVSLGSAVVAAVGETIRITANPASAVVVPESLVVASGQNSKTFSVIARPTASNQTVSIIATLRKTSLTRTLTVQRPVLKEVTVATGSSTSGLLASLYPGEARSVSVKLTGAVASPATVQLPTTDGTLLGIPASVTIPQGQSSVTFTVRGNSTIVDDTATFKAVFEGEQLTRSIEVKRLPRPVSLSTAISFGMDARMALRVTATLDRDPPSSGTVFVLTSDNPSRLSILEAPEMGTNGQVLMSTRSWTTRLSILTSSGPAIPAAVTGNGVEYRVQNASDVVPVTVRLEMKSSSTTGDVASASTNVQLWPYVLTLTQTLGGLATAPTVTVRVNGAAPASGAVVTLSMTERPGISVPATVTIPAGALSVTYQPTIAAGANIHGVTFTATYAGRTASTVVP